jgi:hypothetical protein
MLFEYTSSFMLPDLFYRRDQQDVVEGHCLLLATLVCMR